MKEDTLVEMCKANKKLIEELAVIKQHRESLLSVSTNLHTYSKIIMEKHGYTAEDIPDLRLLLQDSKLFTKNIETILKELK